MSNPNFAPEMSTNAIYVDQNDSLCLTDLLDDMQSDIGDKANTNHAHSEYSSTSHEHSEYSVTNHTHSEYSPTAHEHSEYASNSHEHNNYATSDHTHDGFATSDHTHEYAALEHTHMDFASNSVSTYKQIFIATDGNDANNGLTASSPMATIKEAIRKYGEQYKMLDIRLADGVYNENIGSISVDHCNMSIRSVSEDKEKVTINTSTTIESNLPKFRLYNITINVTEDNVRPISVNAGELYAYNVRINVPTSSTMSCVNVYNGCTAFLMNCVLNSGTGATSGAAIYGNQANMVKAINCTSERTVNIAFHAHNGSDIWYTNTITATTPTKETYYGKCVVR